MTRPPTAAHLRAQVEAVLRHDPDAGAVALRADPAAAYPDTIDLDGRPMRVAPCRGPLAVAEALAAAAAASERVVLLVDVDAADLGDDVRARIARGRVVQVAPWRMVQDLFGADSLDPRLVREKWAAGVLVDTAPPGGYPPAPSAVLTLEAARDTVLTVALGFAGGDPDTADVVAWAADPVRAARYARLDVDARDGVRVWIADRAGPGAAAVLAAVERGHADDAVALGLVCDVLWPHDDGADLDKARGRFEANFTGEHPVDARAGRAWADAAVAVIRRGDGGDHDAAGARAEALLASVGAADEAWRSAHLAAGFVARLERFAAALDAAVDAPAGTSSAALDAAAAAVRASTVGPHRHERAEAAEMALRLVRHLQDVPDDDAAGFDVAVARYVGDGGYLDWAREAISHGDALTALNAAYRKLGAAVAERRDRENRVFARHLAKWTGVGGDRVPTVEIARALEVVAAPIARRHPVLVLVADGMGYATYRELSQELTTTGAGWRRLRPAGTDQHVSAVAVAPSVTSVSRASLLAGRVTEASGKAEKQVFAAHPALVAASRAGLAPLLFHKGDLGHGGLAPDVQAAIADPERRVVGAVVNAVDDSLDRGDQVHVDWSLRSVPALRHLTDAAHNAGRVVVLTADHGHVIEHGHVEQRHGGSGGGARWRPAGDDAAAPDADEVELSGPGVLVPGAATAGGTVVAAATETLRYAAKKAGYHGGATPQEMLVPVAVLAPAGVDVEGWDELAPEEPLWWSGDVVAAPVEPVQLTIGTGPADVDDRPAAAVPDWVRKLVASKTWGSQREIAPRGAPDDGDAGEALALLVARDATMTVAAFALARRIPESRVTGYLRLLQKLLNVEGYAVLSIEADTVTLNRELLAQQFEVEVPR